MSREFIVLVDDCGGAQVQAILRPPSELSCSHPESDDADARPAAENPFLSKEIAAPGNKDCCSPPEPVPLLFGPRLVLERIWIFACLSIFNSKPPTVPIVQILSVFLQLGFKRLEKVS